MLLDDDEIREILVGKLENYNVDIKTGFTWKTKSHNTLEIIKDIMGMANTQDGGTLIIGFNEKKSAFQDDDPNWFESFNQTVVMNSVNRFSTSKIMLQVILKLDFDLYYEKGNLVIIEVKEFQKEIVIAKDGTDSNGKSIFYEGDVLIRTESASTEKIQDSKIMQELIHRATLKEKQEIIREFASIMGYETSNKKKINLSDYSIIHPTSDIREQYLSEIVDFTNTFLKSELFPTFEKGIWQVEIMPIKKNPNLIQLKDLWETATKSQSRHRGWPFPIISEEITKTKNTYLETFVPLDSQARNNECWRLYRDGLFCWAKSMFENESPQYSGTLSKVNAIWTIAEMLLFTSRVYAKFLGDSDKIYIKITITGTHERRYHDEMMSEYGSPIDNGNKSNSDFIDIERTIPILNWKLNLQNEINNIIEELDAHFGVRKYDQEYTTRLTNQIFDMHMINPKY